MALIKRINRLLAEWCLYTIDDTGAEIYVYPLPGENKHVEDLLRNSSAVFHVIGASIKVVTFREMEKGEKEKKVGKVDKGILDIQDDICLTCECPDFV